MTTSPRDLPSKPTHAFVARKPCGCASLISSDIPEMRADAAEALARAVMVGHIPGYLPHAEAAALPWACPACTAPALAKPANTPLELDASTRPGAPSFHFRGTLTYQVTVLVNAVVKVDGGQDKAYDELFELLRPTSLYVAPEQLEIEWHEDDLSVTATDGLPSARLADQMPLSLE
ncbi:hypothetical protein [Chloroflexus sp.]|uniref:hypothetical protein n=1 Tax=Chloroflexus sp. TaxID=1904827 RepID=UPI002ACE6D85|nr:hypothetical protein [Chloroflexus sp.]